MGARRHAPGCGGYSKATVNEWARAYGILGHGVLVAPPWSAGVGRRVMRRAMGVGAGIAGAVTVYLLGVRGALTLDLGLGRRLRPLGPMRVTIAAPPETVFDVISAPYLKKTPRAMRTKVRVLERGSDMVLAAHFTPLGARLTVTTVETIRFERPACIAFRLVRGPVPHLTETFELRRTDDGTEIEYRGELGTDLWRLGSWWGRLVAGPWERTVAESLSEVRTEAEGRAGVRGTAA